MRLQVKIDDALMREALELSGLSQRATIEAALQFVVDRERRAAMQRLRGVGWEGDLDAMRADQGLPP